MGDRYEISKEQGEGGRDGHPGQQMEPADNLEAKRWGDEVHRAAEEHGRNVNSKTVTAHLRFLENNNIIDRVMYAEIPPRVEYSLTEHGKAVLPVFEEMLTWGESTAPP